MLKYALITCAVLALGGPAALANGKKEPMCVAKTVLVCDEGARPARTEVSPPAKAEKISEKSDEVCIKRCLSDEAWKRCKTGSWFANMKGHPNAKPDGDKATEFSTERFFSQCGWDCRKRGTMRFGYESKVSKGGTGEWTVFRYGHPED